MATEEELSQMSPEELAEFQTKNCIFCKISSGEVPSKTVYSDEDCVVVLDISPAAKGHMLLMPKKHHSVMPQLPEHLTEHLFMVARSLSQAALRGLNCNGTSIFVANGIAAGQRAPHFMVHLIPRNDDDGISLKIPQTAVPEKEAKAAAEKLKKALGAKSGDAKTPGEEKKPKKKPQAGPAKKKKAAGKKTPPGGFDLDAVTDLFAGGKNA